MSVSKMRDYRPNANLDRGRPAGQHPATRHNRRMVTTKASVSDAESQRERDNRDVAYRAALEGIVLLENDGALPLTPGPVALYGAGGRRTIKGGTGSGEVNERHSVSVEEGLTAAGFTVTTKAWLDDYDSSSSQLRRRTAARSANGFARRVPTPSSRSSAIRSVLRPADRSRRRTSPPVRRRRVSTSSPGRPVKAATANLSATITTSHTRNRTTCAAVLRGTQERSSCSMWAPRSTPISPARSLASMRWSTSANSAPWAAVHSPMC